MNTCCGAMPLRLTPVLLCVTTPSLSSLPFVPRLDETAGDPSGRVCGFRKAMAAGMIGTEGANFVRFGRGIATQSVRCLLRGCRCDDVDRLRLRKLGCRCRVHEFKTRLDETKPFWKLTRHVTTRSSSRQIDGITVKIYVIWGTGVQSSHCARFT